MRKKTAAAPNASIAAAATASGINAAQRQRVRGDNNARHFLSCAIIKVTSGYAKAGFYPVPPRRAKWPPSPLPERTGKPSLSDNGRERRVPPLLRPTTPG